ncbi:CRISPR-associated protein Cas1/Cas4 [Candidatus Magnetomorum sp. HK-1]|nr:CRISPR-associated protein Cas1/Cas4 [Candidatus Magnetomorum sp. HK-1]
MNLIPISYLNAYVYCPRRFYLEYVRGLFEDNIHTIEGRKKHQRVDGKGKEGKAIKKDVWIHRRSVVFSDNGLGITGKLDLLEETDSQPPYPVEYKKGKKPKKLPWLNDQVQLCAQGLLMAANGLPMPVLGYLYYISSKARVDVALSTELIETTKKIVFECRSIAENQNIPPLAENRNKCFGCSLNAICLPEEECVLQGEKVNAKKILPSNIQEEVLYVDRIGAYVSLSKGLVEVKTPDAIILAKVSLEHLREIVLCGPVQITTQALHECMKRHISVHYTSLSGRYVGSAMPLFHFNGILRESQWKAHFNSEQSLYLAKIIVSAKIKNMRTVMMRYLRELNNTNDKSLFNKMTDLRKQAESTTTTDSLRAYEGLSARCYFENFSRFIKEFQNKVFIFKGRNRRPPKDPVNALLSFGYSLLSKDCTSTGIRVGFDSYCGFYHTMKYGRPSLALDIMEVFRQPIVDSTVLTCINNGVFTQKDFLQYQGVCYLNERGRKKFIAQYEMRKKDYVTHPQFHYRMSYARTIELQFRLLAKFLLGDIDTYTGFYFR